MEGRRTRLDQRQALRQFPGDDREQPVHIAGFRQLVIVVEHDDRRCLHALEQRAKEQSREPGDIGAVGTDEFRQRRSHLVRAARRSLGQVVEQAGTSESAGSSWYQIPPIFRVSR